MKTIKRTKRQGFTKEQHLEVGKKLTQINAELNEIVGEIRLNFGRNDRTSVLGVAATEALDKLRLALYNDLAEQVDIQEWKDKKLMQVHVQGEVGKPR